MQGKEPTAKQKRSAIVTALVLAAMAVGIYLTVIAQFVVHA